MGRPRKQENPTPDSGKTPKPGHNGFNPQTVNSFVARIENLHGEIDSERGKYMAACKGIRAGIKDTLDDAKDSGIPKRALKSVIKARALERKAAAVRDELEAEDQDAHDLLRQALGDLAELPLGRAALGEQPFGAAPPA
jgi:uncharacterized protein (UPF0335 family)